MADKKICVFLLVQNRLLREGLEKLLRKEASIELVGASPLDTATPCQIIDFNLDILVVETRVLASHDSQYWSVLPDLQGMKLVVIGTEPDEGHKRPLPSVVCTPVPWEASAVDVVKAILANGRSTSAFLPEPRSHHDG